MVQARKRCGRRARFYLLPVSFWLVVAGFGVHGQGPEHNACEQGDVEACWTIGDRHSSTREQMDDLEEVALALRYLEKACEGGKTIACSRIGALYDGSPGSALPNNYTLAQKYFQLACDLGSTVACRNSMHKRAFGHIYPPSGESPDKVELSKCERGNPESCYEVAKAYLGREPLDELAQKASPYLEKSCRGGHGQACVELAFLYVEGLGVDYDLALARINREKACALGNASACVLLGFRFRDGTDGLPKDEEQSQMYFEKSCRLGWTPACNRVKKEKSP